MFAGEKPIREVSCILNTIFYVLVVHMAGFPSAHCKRSNLTLDFYNPLAYRIVLQSTVSLHLIPLLLNNENSCQTALKSLPSRFVLKHNFSVDSAIGPASRLL